MYAKERLCFSRVSVTVQIGVGGSCKLALHISVVRLTLSRSSSLDGFPLIAVQFQGLPAGAERSLGTVTFLGPFLAWGRTYCTTPLRTIGSDPDGLPYGDYYSHVPSQVPSWT